MADPAALRRTLASGKPSVSFEFMLVNSEADEHKLWQAIRELEPLRPSFVSVTYGVDEPTRDDTVRITGKIAEHTTLTPVGHLTAVNHSVAELRQIIGRYAAAGVPNMLALRGDPPGDPRGEWIPHPAGLRYASELVALLKTSGDFCVGVAAFPEGHPRSPDPDTDLAYFVAKCRAGADFAITQMFFFPDDYLRLRDRAAAFASGVPIIAGIMPVTSLATIGRMAASSGAQLPGLLLERLHRHAGDKAAVRAIGIDYAVTMCARLLAEGAAGLHFYTLNGSHAARQVYQQLGLAEPVTNPDPLARISRGAAPTTTHNAVDLLPANLTAAATPGIPASVDGLRNLPSTPPLPQSAAAPAPQTGEKSEVSRAANGREIRSPARAPRSTCAGCGVNRLKSQTI